ncbi:hypothetical protein BWD42_07530 [Sphingobacterium sp. CZ-UAM]|uniref:peptide-N-glycosidase F-related protein n=1 Tax=Sphingobacterium sp. CZ-UAM TaxID=1933868 RepID=UPI0009842D77|nr:peptide-N-glycosidase F-related protein [Sphingobacterium sp. CZ-UAM]OOG19743.1 hypothetical protein BWD42_07530 [Sphingobacterium sp. CZ-UAM]
MMIYKNQFVHGYMLLACACLFFQSCKQDQLTVTPLPTERTVLPNQLRLSEKENFYGGYGNTLWTGCPVNTKNTRRYGPGAYIKLLSPEEKAQIGNSIDFRIELHAAYDQWDRNAYSWYIKVPKGKTGLADINPNDYTKTSFIHYTTPYFAHDSTPNKITYKRDVSEFAPDLRDPAYDVYIGYEIGANPTNKSNGGYLDDGWQKEYCSYAGFHAEVFIDTKTKAVLKEEQDNTVVLPLLSEGIRAVEYVEKTFTTDTDMQDAYLRISSSGHGSGNMEEGMFREFEVILDDKTVEKFSTEQSCTPRSYYDDINPYGGGGWTYPTRNWCQGGEIIVHKIALGKLSKGTHRIKLDVAKVLGTLDPLIINKRVPVSNGNYLQTYLVLVGQKVKP